MTQRSPTFRLLTGLVITLLAVGIYSGYTIRQLRSLRTLQTETIDRNRTDTLLLLRIQNGLNSLALTMRDMLDEQEPYPLTAWAPQFRRIRSDLEDAFGREEKFSLADRSPNQRRYLADSFRQFWDGLDRIFDQARAGDEREARTRIRLSLQARQAALSTAVSRLLIQNNESEQTAAARTQEIYAGVERNVYIFLSAMLVVILLTSLYLVHHIRRLFAQVDALSTRRGELAQQLISMQESTFRSISRDLHDDFGQILTAIGVMLQRADRRPGDLLEVRQIVQDTLEKVRALSHALHPVALDEVGLESALDSYLSGFERQTGIAITYEKHGEARELDRETAVHLYRVTQEALNNVAKHARVKQALVRLTFTPAEAVLEIQDFGVGITRNPDRGLGLVSMRERTEMMKGKLEIARGETGGTLVRVVVPVSAMEGVHA
ncbi:MAG TPA: sensor histidine kinase [Rhizomicrobium sp.]|nr:sensor histidine kinase [Rhizomicrobium sp.]